MKTVEEFITRNDIYYIAVPIILTIISPIIKLILESFKPEKNWRCNKHRSSISSYMRFLILVLLLGVIVALIIMICFGFLFKVLEIHISANSIFRIASGFVALVYFVFLVKLTPDPLIYVFKRKLKYASMLRRVMCKLPLLISGIYWTLQCIDIQNEKIISPLGWIIYMLEICSFIILDNKDQYEYKYMTIILENNEKIQKIKIQSVFQRRKWIILKTKLPKKEIRLRIADIKRVEYYN